MSISYKSFCWNFGTTSFRTKNFNKTIEEQLDLLDKFWLLEENKGKNWNSNNELQTRYYNYMQEKGFVEGDAGNKPKDAREKTSGLVDIGLIDDARHLTSVGNALLELCKSDNFSPDNFFEIPSDSYIYLKQLLKTSSCVNNNTVRPFIILLYVLSQVDELSMDEFTYMLPLCTNSVNTEKVISAIGAIAAGALSIDDFILERLMNMDNYKSALSLFLDKEVNEDLICEVGINRKSRAYDKDYFPLYKHLYRAYIEKDSSAFSKVYEAVSKIKIGKWWKEYLFKTRAKKADIIREPFKFLNHTLFDFVQNEGEFKTAFFKVMHLFKAKATLLDYKDLNRRYIKITDIVLFEDNVVKLDIVPKHFFKSVINELYKQAYSESERLCENCGIRSIDPCLSIDEQTVIEGVNAELDTEVTSISEARVALEEDRYVRFKHLIETKFTTQNLITLLNCFETRNDDKIRSMVTDNAEVPTIFEYVLAILWYKVSECKGKILDYMKLSLDADLLPKTHAGGGEADIVYEYEKTENYPTHSLLIEATLSDSTNQRRMEMEPVSRHLGQHLIRTGNMNSYCVFATNDLNINVISDFRCRKTTPYFDQQDYTHHVDGMKIIPLKTSELKRIIEASKTYKELYPLFEEAFHSPLPIPEWYNNCIEAPLC